ncbi:hypothetical protein [Glycomyces niveus]|uniref:Uncharacterized protein n=1 Tax=Glycomyces niveus TaxID=2820287 RepID=A0ABS3U9D1_9ACTN|nr:hypothetical protein [Glycomyces sp. NEAU-S30]MBO3735385.1 hypothetical protein [Glycomyces sp. NEAU-S30]
MVSVSVRRNPGEPVGRNARASYPHPENPGLLEQVDGFYDWAGRRLFLADGSPDPMTPGAYRYQTRPDLCDLIAHASDPASPHYEPPHLRHRPGDTWEIGGKPHDPGDPGPFGSDGWRPDPRTGRHRRDELPDPIPPWEQGPAAREAEPAPSPERTQEEAPLVEPGRPPARLVESGSRSADRGGSDRPPPGGRRGRPVPSDSDDPEPSEEDSPRSRFWSDDERPGGRARSRNSVDPGWISGSCDTPVDDDSESEDPPPHRFSKLREDAWDRFMIKSAPLAAAHWSDRRTLGDQHRWLAAVLLRAFLWLAAVFKGRSASAPACPAGPALPRQAGQRSNGQTPPRGPVPAGAPQPDAFPGGPVPDAGGECVPDPFAQLAAAVNGARAGRAAIAARKQASRGDLAAEIRSAAKHWRAEVRQSRSKPSPVPYMARWERAFDAHRAFGEVAVG